MGAFNHQDFIVVAKQSSLSETALAQVDSETYHDLGRSIPQVLFDSNFDMCFSKNILFVLAVLNLENSISVAMLGR